MLPLRLWCQTCFLIITAISRRSCVVSHGLPAVTWLHNSSRCTRPWSNQSPFALCGSLRNHNSIFPFVTSDTEQAVCFCSQRCQDRQRRSICQGRTPQEALQPRTLRRGHHCRELLALCLNTPTPLLLFNPAHLAHQATVKLWLFTTLSQTYGHFSRCSSTSQESSDDAADSRGKLMRGISCEGCVIRRFETTCMVIALNVGSRIARA